MRLLAIGALLAAVHCSGRVDTEKPEPAPTAAPATLPRGGLVLRNGMLMRLVPDGRTENVIAARGARSCDVDDVHRTVWLVGESTVAAYDQVTGKLHHVASGSARIHQWRVQYVPDRSPYPSATAGTVDDPGICAALVVDVGPQPKVGGGTVAEGDGEWGCFDFPEDVEEADFDEPQEPPPNAETAEELAGYDRARLLDAQFLRTLDARRVEARPRRPRDPPAPRVAVDRRRCNEDPAECGQARYIGGRLWWIVTDNSRGDFFHEGLQLYDAQAKAFWDLASGRRSPRPFPEGIELPALEASRDRTWAVSEQKIISLTEARVVGTFTGVFCGFE